MKKQREHQCQRGKEGPNNRIQWRLQVCNKRVCILHTAPIDSLIFGISKSFDFDNRANQAPNVMPHSTSKYAAPPACQVGLYVSFLVDKNTSRREWRATRTLPFVIRISSVLPLYTTVGVRPARWLTMLATTTAAWATDFTACFCSAQSITSPAA